MYGCVGVLRGIEREVEADEVLRSVQVRRCVWNGGGADSSIVNPSVSIALSKYLMVSTS